MAISSSATALERRSPAALADLRLGLLNLRAPETGKPSEAGRRTEGTRPAYLT